MTSQTEVLCLFDEFGDQLNVSRRTLLKLEAQKPNIRFHRKALGDKPGTYWLVSARPGNVRMLLEIHLHKGHKTDEWSMGWCTNGIASYPHWELESSLKIFLDRKLIAPSCGEDDIRPCHDPRLPANVEELVREHVYFVPDVKGTREGDEVRSQFALKMVSARRAKRRLAKLTNADTSTLITEYAGRRVEIMEVMLAAEFFCAENPDAAGKTLAVVKALTKQRIKLFFLTGVLEEQLSHP